MGFHLRLSGIAAAAQTLVSVGLLFWTYRTVNGVVGEEAFGVWATVVGVTAFLQIAEMGMSMSVLRLASVAHAQHDLERTTELIETGLITASAGLLIAALVVAGPLWMVFHLVFASQQAALASSLLPWALGLAVLNALSMVIIQALDTFFRAYERAMLLVATQALMALIAVAYAPQWGIHALLIGQVIQSATFVAGGWARLRLHLAGKPLLPVRWSRKGMRDLLRYGVRWQAIGVVQAFFDPLMRLFLGRFGGTAWAGQFEYASKVVLQSRNVGASLLQTLVPWITRIETDTEETANLRTVMERGSILMAGGMAPLLVLSAPLMANIWTTAEPENVQTILVVLTFGWSINLLGAPAYFVRMGHGAMSSIFRSHAATTLAGIAFGLLLGWKFGGLGVVLAYTAALIAGAVAIGLPRTSSLTPSERPAIVLAGMGFLAGALLLHVSASAALSLGMCVLYASAYGYVLLRHPLVASRLARPSSST